MYFEKLPESLRTSIYEGLDSTHGTNIDDPASTVFVYYDLSKVKRFNRNTLLFALIMCIAMITTIGLTGENGFGMFVLFMGFPALLFAFGLNCFRLNNQLKSLVGLPAITVTPDGLTIIGSSSATPSQFIPWNAISSATVSKGNLGTTMIVVAIHDSEEARLGVRRMGVLSYREFSIVQKFLSNLVPDNKRVVVFGNHLYVDPNDVVKIINERAAYYREQRNQ